MSFAVATVGSNVWESTPSGTSPSTSAAWPATFRAMSVSGDTVVTTSIWPSRRWDAVPQPARRAARTRRTPAQRNTWLLQLIAGGV